MSQISLLYQLSKYKKCLLHPIVQYSRSRLLLHTSVAAAQQSKRQEAGGANGSLQRAKERSDVSTDVRPLGEKIKENTKTASYTAIIIAGVGVTGVLFYAIFKELFSSSSPNNIYAEALEKVKEDYRVQDAIGSPIKGFGEESRRGRRQHVAHSMFERNGVPHMRMQFYVQGLRNKATVHLESRRTPSGKMEFRYLFVQLNSYPHTTIIIEDNRAFDATSGSTPGMPATPFENNSNVALTSFEK